MVNDGVTEEVSSVAKAGYPEGRGGPLQFVPQILNDIPYLHGGTVLGHFPNIT